MTDSATFDRRAAMLAMGAGGLALAAPLRAAAGAGGSIAVTSPELARLLDAFAEEILRINPDQATQLGVDYQTRSFLRAQLTDLSSAGDAKWTAQAKSMKTRLQGIAAERLTPVDRLRYDTIAYSADRALEGAAFRFGPGARNGLDGGAHPYAVSQQDGAVQNIPEFLNTAHPVKTRADCQSYIARVHGFARQLDQETARIASNAAIGVIPPSFVCATTLGQLRKYRATPAADQPLVASLVARATKAGIAGDWGAQATTILEREVYPALDRQIAAFAQAATRATANPSVYRLPDGEAYYAWALRLGTTTTQTPDYVHKVGLDQNEAIKAEMDALLKSQGMTRGTVGERIGALNRDPRFLYPDTDQGRADLIAFLNGKVAAIRPLLPRLSNLALKADVQVKRVPVDIQDGAPLGYMNFASLDGTRPAIYYVNLKSTALWPRYQLATLTAHEGIPGHTWQGAYQAEHHAEIPLVFSLIGFNAYTEGWALYAEQLVDELGLYANDPFSRLGYLQAAQFRACRLVVDTGIHAMGWSREKAVAFLTDQSGKGDAAMTSEVDRYCSAPGQACGYKTGQNAIVSLRAKAKAALGPRFELQGFDDAVIEAGAVPLPLLDGVVDRWMASRRG